MTITVYFYTFGFLVRKSDAIKALGFTLTDERRRELKEEFYGVGEEGEAEMEEHSEEDILEEWFEYFGQSEDGGVTHIFEIEGTVYVVRKFQHDSPDSKKHYVVGVHVGKIGRFNGRAEMTFLQGDRKREMAELVSNEVWWKAIQKVTDQPESYRPKKYGVHHPCGLGFIVPSLYQTTDDCDCCT